MPPQFCLTVVSHVVSAMAMAASASPTGCPPPRPPSRYVVVALSFHVAPSSLVSGGGQQEESSRSLVHASGRQHFFPAENLERNNTYAEKRADCNTIYRIFTIRWTSQPSASPFDCIANVVYICGCHHASCLTFIAGSQRAVTAWEASFPLVRPLPLSLGYDVITHMYKAEARRGHSVSDLARRKGQKGN